MAIPTHARLLARRTLLAAPVALLIPGAVAAFDLIERGAAPTDAALLLEALLRALMTVGVLVPLTAAVIAVTALQTSRQWMALELLGYRPVQLLLPVQLTAAGLALLLAALLALAPLPTLHDTQAATPLADGPAWIIPLSDDRGALRVDPQAMEIRQIPDPPRLDRGQRWTATRRMFFAPTACALLALLALWSGRARRDPVTSALARLVAVAGLTLLAETILGLFAMSGALEPWIAMVWLDGTLLGFGVVLLAQDAKT